MKNQASTKDVKAPSKKQDSTGKQSQGPNGGNDKGSRGGTSGKGGSSGSSGTRK
jgi:hypothetical protein